MRGTVGAVFAVAAISAISLTACAAASPLADAPLPVPTIQTAEAAGTPTAGDAALWQLIDAGSVDADSTELRLSVTRLACASGETGKVLEPRVTYEPARVVIDVDVEPLVVGQTYTCQGNDSVPVTVDLKEPIGERPLIDGGCDEIANLDHTVCENPIRWQQQAP